MNKKVVALVVTAATAIAVTSQTSVAQSAVNYFDQTTVVSGTGTATCPSGYKVTGGGPVTINADYYGTISSDEYELTGSYPISTTQWKVTGTRVHGTYSSISGWHYSTSSYTPMAKAVCVR